MELTNAKKRKLFGPSKSNTYAEIEVLRTMLTQIEHWYDVDNEELIKQHWLLISSNVRKIVETKTNN